MIQIINQIYWDRINSGFMAGTSLKKDANEIIQFKNYLMPAGKTIIKWSSSLNYQASKEVPRLPILLSNKTYRLNIDLDTKPANTVIFCLRFFDLQTNEIKKIVFTDQEKEFIYPSDAVSYTFEIISGGCKEITFRRAQIGEAKIPIEAFDNFYPVTFKASKNKENKKIGLLLVADSKRARELNNFSLPNVLNFTLIIGYLSWQTNASQLKGLEDLIKKYSDQDLVIFSSSQTIDNFLQKNKFDIIETNKIVPSTDLTNNPIENSQTQWFNLAVNETNLQDAVNQTIEYLKE